MNSNGNWQLGVDSSVYAVLTRFPRKDARRVSEVIESLAMNPYAGDVKKLGGKDNLWRRRVGAYRIFYEISTTRRRVDVSEVDRRGSKTY